MATRLRRFVPTVLAATRRHTMIYAFVITCKEPGLRVLSRETIQNGIIPPDEANHDRRC